MNILPVNVMLIYWNLQKQRKLEEGKAERNRRRLQELAEMKARAEQEKEIQFLQEQEVRYAFSCCFVSLMRSQKQKKVEEEKVERQKRRLQELAEKKAKEEHEKELQFQKEQEVHECLSVDSVVSCNDADNYAESASNRGGESRAQQEEAP